MKIFYIVQFLCLLLAVLLLLRVAQQDFVTGAKELKIRAILTLLGICWVVFQVCFVVKNMMNLL